jgi:hypothetical protein
MPQPLDIMDELFYFNNPQPDATVSFDASCTLDLGLTSDYSSATPLSFSSPIAPSSSSSSSPLSVLSMGDVEFLFAKYTAHIHPCYPFLDQEWFIDRLRSGEAEGLQENDGLFATMVLALCALTMAFMSDVMCSDQGELFKARRDKVMSEVILRHYTRALGVSTTIEQIITTFHLGLYFAITVEDAAGHFRIAEAAHLARSMGLHRANTYSMMNPQERRRAMAVYCFVMAANR